MSFVPLPDTVTSYSLVDVKLPRESKTKITFGLSVSFIDRSFSHIFVINVETSEIVLTGRMTKFEESHPNRSTKSLSIEFSESI